MINKANIIYLSLIKCQKVIHSILIAKLYKIVNGFDIKAIIKTIMRMILGLAISLILCIDLKSLYNYFIKLGITQENQLIIDMISLRQLYK